LAEVLASVDIGAAPARVLALISDLSMRAQILPDGWRVLRFLSEHRGGVGAAIEVEARIGPQPTTHVIQIQTLLDSGGQRQLIESPPPADNYLTTWTVRDGDGGTAVYLHTEFEYGGFIGEFLARRRLRRAHEQMLARLKALAERREDT
jgi:hypothetical protein